MALGKTPEQKAAEHQQRAANAYWTSPIGQAQRAREEGARFFQIELPHSSVSGYANLMWSAAGTSQKIVQHGGAPDVLGQIEEVGWRLENVSHVFIETVRAAGTSSWLAASRRSSKAASSAFTCSELADNAPK